jgi:hypothetical protein
LPAQTQPCFVCWCALERFVAEGLPVGVVDRRFERGRRDVSVEHARVRVVEDRGLHPPAEERLGLAHEVLVERVLRGHENREPVALPSGPAPLLAQACDRPWEADGDCAVEQADVDAELQRVGRRDAEELPTDEAPLDVPPLLRRVARPVRGEPLGRRRVHAVGRHAVDELRRLPALREADRPELALHQLGHQARRIGEGARADPELGVDQLRVPERDRPLGARRRIVSDDGRLDPEQRVRELSGVRDRGRGEQELRLRAVDARHAP